MPKFVPKPEIRTEITRKLAKIRIENQKGFHNLLRCGSPFSVVFFQVVTLFKTSPSAQPPPCRAPMA